MCSLALATSAQEAGSQSAHRFSKTVTLEMEAEYLLYLPEGYSDSGSEEWPLLIFLHGAGERGSDIEKVKVHGPPKIAEREGGLPFIVVSPQCPSGSWWDIETLNALLDEVMAERAVDPSRVYLTGLSMGGFGSWAWAAQSPERFAAAAPICGGGEPRSTRRGGTEKRSARARLPIWNFHGAQDTVVRPEQSEEMVEAWKQLGANVKYTVYPDAGHDSWTVTYDNPELYEWFLSHERGGE